MNIFKHHKKRDSRNVESLKYSDESLHEYFKHFSVDSYRFLRA